MERGVKPLSELDDKLLWDESPEYLGKSFLLEFYDRFYNEPAEVEDIIKPIVDRYENLMADTVERHLLEAVQWLSNKGLLAEIISSEHIGRQFFITREGHIYSKQGITRAF